MEKIPIDQDIFKAVLEEIQKLKQQNTKPFQ